MFLEGDPAYRPHAGFPAWLCQQVKFSRRCLSGAGYQFYRDWLNLHTAYDFAFGDVATTQEITLCRNFERRSTHSRIRLLTGRSGMSCAGRWEPAASSVPASHWHSINHLLGAGGGSCRSSWLGSADPRDKVSFADELRVRWLLQFYTGDL